MQLNFAVRPVFLPLWKEQNWRYAIVMGGRGAGRSTAASQYICSRLPSNEYMRGAIMRAIHTDIRHTSWKELKDRLDERDAAGAFGIREDQMGITYGKNSVQAHGFKTASSAHTAKLKSLASYNVVWIEEAEEIDEADFMTLDDSLRTVRGNIRIILTLNTPSKDHWIVKKWFNTVESEQIGFYNLELKEGMDDVLYIPANYETNLPNLDAHTIKRYEHYRITNPAYYWQKIKGLSPETVMGRIYTGWNIIPELPHEARLLGYGLDFGFDPDPAAVVGIYWHNGGYILHEKLYQRELINEHLAASCKAFTPAPYVADSAEPKSIAELNMRGMNVIPAEKGRDSVNFGIKHVQGLRISVTAQSHNLIKEYENYVWKLDKDGNKVGTGDPTEIDHLGVPDPKCADHALDAARYALATFAKTGMYDPDQREREIAMQVLKERQYVSTASSRYGL